MLIHSAILTGSLSLNSTDLSATTGSAGFATTSSVNGILARTGSYSTTGSNQFNGNQSISGSITSNGTITAQTLVVQTITSSVDFVTGSAKFGSIIGNTHQFTGSVLVSGSGTFASSVNASTFTSNINSGVFLNNSAGGTNATQLRINNTSGDLRLGIESSGGATIQLGTLAYAAVLGNQSNNALQFTTNGTARITIAAGGNVGIGVSDPTAMLHVQKTVGADTVGGNIILDRNNSSSYRGGAIFSYYYSANAAGNQDTLSFGMSIDSTSPATVGKVKMVLTESGNVGIGTTAPSARLHVEVATESPATGAVALIARTSNGNNDIFRWFDGATQLGVFKNSGNVGIGTTAPSEKLHLNNASGAGAFIRFEDTGGSGVYLGGRNNNMELYAGGTERMRITSAGQVLVGATSSYASVFPFQVGNGTADTRALFIPNNPYSIGLANGASSFWYIGVNAQTAANGLQFYSNQLSGTAMTITTAGNVGIGTTSPTHNLHINSSLRANRSVYNWYSGAWQGNSTYWHIKTNMWGGGSPNGNTQYTMSYFKGYSYSYSASILEGAVGFHNFNGIIYSYKTTGNIFSNAYVSSDGFVVLVVPSGQGETGITIDWHQHWDYPFINATVTAAGLHGATSGKY